MDEKIWKHHLFSLPSKQYFSFKCHIKTFSCAEISIRKSHKFFAPLLKYHRWQLTTYTLLNTISFLNVITYITKPFQMIEIHFTNISIDIFTIRCNRKQETRNSITHLEVKVKFQKDELWNSQLLYLAYLLWSYQATLVLYSYTWMMI